MPFCTTERVLSLLPDSAPGLKKVCTDRNRFPCYPDSVKESG
nr:MAG TPA: hypothetical protein [Caudoviricetes sp.]